MRKGGLPPALACPLTCPLTQQRLPGLALVRPSLAPSANRLAAGQLHAQVVLLQKPHLRPASASAASTDDCPASFVQADNLPTWAGLAGQLATTTLTHTNPQLPLVLVGLSEGAELLPTLAATFPHAVLLVLVGHAGLEPAALGSRQAQRMGHAAAWQHRQADTAPGRAPQDVLLHSANWRRATLPVTAAGALPAPTTNCAALRPTICKP